MILSGEGFCEAECEDCGTIIGTEDNMMNACGEPFNGYIAECPNPECDAEYSINIGFKIEKS